MCPLSNETAFITKKLIYLKVLITDFRCNCHPTPHNAETVDTGSRNRAGSPAVPFSSSATPGWMSLMSLLGPVSPSVREEKSGGAKSGGWGGGGLLDHTDRFGSKKLLHIQRAVGGRVVVHVVSELLVSDTAHAPTDVPSLLNNSACLLLVPAGTNSRWI